MADQAGCRHCQRRVFRRADGVRWQNAGRQYLADAAAQTVAAFRDIATGQAVIALVVPPFVAYTGRKIMAIAEIIHKKWVEPILADNYNRGRVEGLAEGRVEGVSDADQEWEAWLTRREIAVANGEPFDEPTPSRRR